MTSRDTFGPELRRQRERQRVTLDEIERTSKISRALLAGLERNDLSRWPGGLYRRAFFRAYVVAIGLPPEPLLPDFLRFFPESGQPPHIGDDDAFRIGLVAEPRWPLLARRAAAVAIDACAVAVAAYIAAMLGANFWVAIAAAAIVSHGVCTIGWGRSFGSWWVARVGARSMSPAAARWGRRAWVSEVADLLTTTVPVSLDDARSAAQRE
jgi:transcriptional regulator with XRE-family HTH domain